MSTQSAWRPEFNGCAAIHAALTAVMGWLAAILAFPGDSFGLSPAFAFMARTATEDHWAMMFCAAASVGMVGMFTPSRLVRLGSVLIVATMHGVIALGFAISAPATTGSGTYGILALLGYFLAWRRAAEGL